MSISKFAFSGVVVLTLFGALSASAQTYNSCVDISRDLSYGQKGSAVSQLQRFLVAQNYPGGGSWMISGFFGRATMQAVRNFQQTQGLSMTGAADAATRAAIRNATCGASYLPGLGATGYTYAYNYSQSLPYTYGNTYTYPYNTYNYGYNTYYNQYGTCGSYPYTYPCSNLYGTAPQLTSLSTAIATPGTQVTVYGTGFDAVNNTVYVGGTTLSGLSSANGTQLTFTMPTDLSGTVSISVGNAHGTSNSLTLSTGSYGYPYNTYPNPYPCGYGYYGTYNCPNTQTPVITSLSPQQGAVGTSVTVYGSGFTSTGNTVHFGNGIIANLQSYDGHSVSFIVPSTVSGYGYQPIGLGTYQVSVGNSYGVTSNTMPFTITATGSTVAPSITSVNGPTSVGIGASGTWTLTVQNPSAAYLTTSVNWGDANVYGTQAASQTVSAQGSNTLTFSHIYYTAGTYTITFTVSNGAGQQNTASATVSVSNSGTTGTITLTSVSPVSGRVGTQLALYGTGFDAYNNTVHFGNGGTMHVPSQNGVIYFTVPSYLSPCDVISVGTVCAQYAQLVTLGSYPIYVSSPNGTSNTITFQVTQ